MQFQVPQFLDVEDKIIGPFSIKQFLYMAGGLGLAYLFYHFIPWIAIAFIPMVFSVGLGALLAFYKPYKPNNTPFVFLVEAGFKYIKNVRQYVWRRTAKKDDVRINFTSLQPTHHMNVPLASTTASKLNDMTWAIGLNSNDVEAQKVHSEFE